MGRGGAAGPRPEGGGAGGCEIGGSDLLTHFGRCFDMATALLVLGSMFAMVAVFYVIAWFVRLVRGEN